jgi:hypothetical protein
VTKKILKGRFLTNFGFVNLLILKALYFLNAQNKLFSALPKEVIIKNIRAV